MAKNRFDEISTIKHIDSLTFTKGSHIKIIFDNATFNSREREKLCDRIMLCLRRVRIEKERNDEDAIATVWAG